MQFSEFLAIIRKRWLAVAIPVVLGLGGALAVSFSTQPAYTATSSVYFTLPFAQSANDLFQGSNYTQQQLASYASIATRPIVLQPVIDSLGLDISVAKLSDKVSATPSNETSILAVSATRSSAAAAATIANAVSTQLTKTVADIAPVRTDGKPSVSAVTIGSAVPPLTPSSPNTKKDVLAGGLLGLAIGLLVLFARESLDKRIRTEEDLPSGLAVLGTITKDGRSKGAGTAPDPRDQFMRAEAFRRIRTNLRFSDVDENALHVMVVTSALPQEGKSTFCIDLAKVFAEAGLKVLVIDADLRRPRISQYLGVEGSMGLTGVLTGQVALDDVLQPVVQDRMWILPAGAVPPNPSELLGSGAMADLLGKVRHDFELVILDTPPLLSVTDAAVASVHSDGVLFVVRHGKADRAQLQGALEAVTTVDARILGGALNMVPVKRGALGRREEVYYGESVGRAGWRRRVPLRRSTRSRH